jgi:hypothetical protein
MMPEFIEIVDRYGRRRRARKGEVLADGERFVLPMQFMDHDHAASGFYPTFSDGSLDSTSPHRPGFRFLDMGDHTYGAAFDNPDLIVACVS